MDKNWQVEAMAVPSEKTFCKDIYIKIPVSDDFIERYLGLKSLPSMEDLIDRIGDCVMEWLEGKRVRRNEFVAPARGSDWNNGPTEFFD